MDSRTAVERSAVALHCSGRTVARYVWDPQLPHGVSPRPYLHPVTTLGGTVVTGFMPRDHPHHLGASIAVPVLNGSNFWGGRTYVSGRGPTPLDDHGVQRHVAWIRREPAHLVQRVSWVGRDGSPLADEERVLAAVPLGPDAWALGTAYRLAGATPAPLTIESPGSRGRGAAGYGGFFWRAPSGPRLVLAFSASTPGGTSSAEDLHGRCLPWVALTSGEGAGRWTLVFVADLRPGSGSGDPWFVRLGGYAGVCSALAWDRPATVPPGEVLARRVAVVVCDGRPSTAEAEALSGAARTALASLTGTGVGQATPSQRGGS